MTIEVSEIQRVFRYNGMTLPDVPGMTPREVRDLYSAQYPELISAEVEAGEVANGRQEYTFRKAVGTKGRGFAGSDGQRLAALKTAVELEFAGGTGTTGKLARALTRAKTLENAGAWECFVQQCMPSEREHHAPRVLLTSDMLAPLP
ncbi:PRTRC system protein C [Burkholderia cenocepacia]|jgi:PRTRC genetic system protein C|uniref:PRTRC system protein C n=1 Tax=Dechloromonas agitata TaxID=73030 RepID=A0A930BUE1_9RHOO|nr:PRTRC system protein C [Burkholderia cenocepacia]MBF1166042.1 PRTRC system protein C [Dechloromonas agitata]MDI9689742.1 PRTRC system protein C [Burkholderia cenocepacia]